MSKKIIIAIACFAAVLNVAAQPGKGGVNGDVIVALNYAQLINYHQENNAIAVVDIWLGAI
jgi:hypothetical protein